MQGLQLADGNSTTEGIAAEAAHGLVGLHLINGASPSHAPEHDVAGEDSSPANGVNTSSLDVHLQGMQPPLSSFGLEPWIPQPGHRACPYPFRPMPDLLAAECASNVHRMWSFILQRRKARGTERHVCCVGTGFFCFLVHAKWHCMSLRCCQAPQCINAACKEQLAGSSQVDEVKTSYARLCTQPSHMFERLQVCSDRRHCAR